MARKDELYYESLGPDFDRFMSDYDVERRVALIGRLLAPGAASRGLEVGCGTGAVGEHFVDCAEEFVVTDISERLAHDTGTRLGCSWRQADATALPFEDGSFDLVLSSECVEHTPDPEGAVRELARVVAPGGQLVVTTPNRLWFPLVWLAMLLRIRRFQGNESFLWPRQIRAALEGEGLVVTRVSGCHLFPWQVPGAKAVLPWFDRFGDRLHALMINVAVAARRPDD